MLKRPMVYAFCVWLCVCSTLAQTPGGELARAQVKQLKVTILSTMLADEGIGEWGFAALVEADGHRLLVDTGGRPDTVLSNLHDLGLDLSDVKEVVLTHNHGDHTRGLLTLRQELMKKSPEALSVAHVGKGIMYPRPGEDGKERNYVIGMRKQYEVKGGKFVQHDAGVELFPGVWLTGPVPRKYPEKNWSGTGKMQTPEGLVEDNLPEDQSLVINTDKGLVVVTGCGHAGIINTLSFAETQYPKTPVYAVIGGIHLFAATDQTVDWTADKFKDFGVQYFVGAHCTGINTVYAIRDRLKMSRKSAVVGAVGATFVLGQGIHPGQLAQ
jgi:7,8-dihydropterin-6-yl-methyl-4-(beta-D-ribofuranosyl)aminobenzene 5'-phosphate synthase